MKRRILIVVLLALGGCAPAAAGTTTAAAVSSEASETSSETAHLAELARLRDRNRELTAQLGLARAEASELRDEVGSLREAAARHVTRITPPAQCEPTAAAEPAEAEPRASGPRPVLRLYGTAPPASAGRPAASARGVSALPGPEAPLRLGPPPAAAARLPVVAADPNDPTAGVPAIPLQPVEVEGSAPPPAVTPDPRPREDVAGLAYRAALRAFSERRFPDAVSGFERFVQAHPDHPYADNAMYWRAEIDFTRRDYSGALARFSRLIERYPRGNKVPDALLRIGLCYERTGRSAQARRVFSRLRRQFPNTVAARMASREDA